MDPENGGNQKDIQFKIDNQQVEFDFFKILVLSVILEQPKFFIDKLISRDPFDMYLRAKGFKPDMGGAKRLPLEFHQFYEFISNDIAKALYCKENEFVEME